MSETIPPQPTRRQQRQRSSQIALILALCTPVVMVSLLYGVHALDYDTRPVAFVIFTLLFLPWPVLTALVPSNYLPAAVMFPLLGICIGLRYSTDIGPDSHFIAAVPVALAGMWAAAANIVVLAFRWFRSQDRSRRYQIGG
jgi:lysylphosphatidylglycerol synthetase-like protein (DUF2156 family)